MFGVLGAKEHNLPQFEPQKNTAPHTSHTNVFLCSMMLHVYEHMTCFSFMNGKHYICTCQMNAHEKQALPHNFYKQLPNKNRSFCHHLATNRSDRPKAAAICALSRPSFRRWMVRSRSWYSWADIDWPGFGGDFLGESVRICREAWLLSHFQPFKSTYISGVNC